MEDRRRKEQILNNLEGQQSKKRQYWIVENGRWKITYEAQVREAPLNLPESFRPTPRGPRLLKVVQQSAAPKQR